ncbi:unnamed protein product, partial [Didymodactylos carnosus]
AAGSSFGLVGNYAHNQQKQAAPSSFGLVGNYAHNQQEQAAGSSFGLVGNYAQNQQKQAAPSSFDLVGRYKNQELSQQRSAFEEVGAYKPQSQSKSSLSECNVEDVETVALVQGMFQTPDTLKPNNTFEIGGWWGGSSDASENEANLPKCDMKEMDACHMSSMEGETRVCYNQQNDIIDYGKRILNSSNVQFWRPLNMNLLPFPNVFNITTSQMNSIPNCNKSIVCHNVDNDCSVQMCHALPGTKAYQIEIKYKNLINSVIMIAVCHYKTNEFDKDGIAFRILHKQPGDPICHFFSPRDFVMCGKTWHSGQQRGQ